MKTALLVALLLCASVAAFAVDGPYQQLYVDAYWNQLTGFSSYQGYKYGARQGDNDGYVYLKNEWFDTTGTDLPFLYATRGSSVGVGYRRWFADDLAFATVSVGHLLDGDNAGDTDLRAGLVASREWRQDDHLSDLYSELFWVDLADAALFDARYRSGTVLAENKDGRLWAYGLGQGWASTDDTSGTDNRLEAGVGLGYCFRGHLNLHAELRGGYSYRGEISERTYWNPTLYIAGGF